MTHLTPAERELAALGASIGAGCFPCTEYHLRAGREVGLDSAALLQAIADAECVKRSGAEELSVHARRELGQPAEVGPGCCNDTNRAKEFVSIGAAVGANALLQLRKHIGQALGLGITPAEIEAAVEAAREVQRHAAGVTAREVSRLLAEPVRVVSAPAGSECGPDCGCHDAQAPAPAEAASACCGGEVAEVGAAAERGGCC
ncbi:carboxymuconolactone decarboxylase family protein [Tepidiforma sp.]|uniref:carboxymuconolactone decarboxylase family protein n=1 Tax=Tepidiforma sp. TaxID=2682230 RepID=UPI002ADDE987|nr:carboxymuconolactone decarboxylase family protein [Tepidiforma sp.]